MNSLNMTRAGELRTVPHQQPNRELETALRKMISMGTELRRLRRAMSRQNRRSSIVNQAIADAQTIIIDATLTGSTAQRTMLQRTGMSRRRWQWAIAFLRYAGVIAMRNQDWRAGLTWATDDPKDVLRLIKTAMNELDNERGYKRLLACRVRA